MLDAVGVDTERVDTQMPGEVHPVDHQRDQLQPGQICREQLAESGLGPLHEPARHRRLRRRLRPLLDLLTDGLQAEPVTAGDSPASIFSIASRLSSSVEENSS